MPCLRPDAAFVPGLRTGQSRRFLPPLDKDREAPKLSDFTRRVVPTSDVVQIGDVSQPVVFDPVVNVPALASFLVIAAVFSLLQFRISAIGQAVTRRKTALEELRTLKSMELSNDGKDRPSEEALSIATDEYEAALRNEENLRTVVPGVRLVAPNAPGNNVEDVDAAKRFLGLDLQSSGGESSQPTSSRKGGGGGLSNGAIAILAVVALSQVALLVMLSFDPMTANSTFTSIGGGEPPVDIPLSSW